MMNNARTTDAMVSTTPIYLTNSELRLYYDLIRFLPDLPAEVDYGWYYGVCHLSVSQDLSQLDIDAGITAYIGYRDNRNTFVAGEPIVDSLLLSAQKLLSKVRKPVTQAIAI